MTGRVVYLKHNVLAEPLINRWYAWSHLIAPPTAAMHIANSHIKIMQSFVSAPQIHISALKNPQMLGGPFINYDPVRVSDVKALMENTINSQAHMLALADAIKSLDQLLTGEAEGFSLEPLYDRLPDALKGYVELVYDLNNQPSARFIEGLLYKGKYYDETTQSISLSLIDKDNRSFAMSTPRLKEEGRCDLQAAFKSEALDLLFSMKSSPQPLDEIESLLNVPEKDADLFASFFTESSPLPSAACGDAACDDNALRIRYFGHACLLMESKGESLLTDPVISYKIDNGLPRYTYADLPERIDHLLITHSHQDHFSLETLLQLRHKVKNVLVPKSSGGALADPSLKRALNAVGFKNVTEIDEAETISLKHGTVTGLPFLGEHADLNIRAKLAYLVRMQGRSALVLADSNNVEPKLYQHIYDLTGDIDVIFIGMECAGAPLSWIYGSLLTRPLAKKMDQSRRLDGSGFEKALRIIELFNPRQVYVYAMGQEPWLNYITAIKYTEESSPIIESNKLIAACRKRGLIAERLFGRKEILLQPV